MHYLEIYFQGKVIFRTSYNLQSYETIESVKERYKGHIAYSNMLDANDLSAVMRKSL